MASEDETCLREDMSMLRSVGFLRRPEER